MSEFHLVLCKDSQGRVQLLADRQLTAAEAAKVYRAAKEQGNNEATIVAARTTCLPVPEAAWQLVEERWFSSGDWQPEPTICPP